MKGINKLIKMREDYHKMKRDMSEQYCVIDIYDVKHIDSLDMLIFLIKEGWIAKDDIVSFEKAN